MRVYVDSSALLKRVLAEAESAALTSWLREHVEAGDALASSSLAWVEVSRAIRAYEDTRRDVAVEELVDVALSGVLEKPISSEVIALARRLGPPVLRTLDALHLASALLLDADAMVAYDRRLAQAAVGHGLRVLSPS